MVSREILMRHGLGLVGVMTCSGMALAPFRTLLRARESGSLAGMDTRSWPLYFFNGITWSFYAVMLGDMYMLLANVISVVMWMYFCMAAISLLSREEGELAPPAPDDAGGDAGLLTRKDTLHMHGLSKSYRRKAIRSTEQQLAFGLGLMFILSFLTQATGQGGLEFLDTFTVQERLDAFSYLAMGVAFVCFSSPIQNLWVLIKKRDGSSVFVPYALAQLLHNCVWAGYGMVLANPAVMAPNIPGIFCTVAQILIKLRWPGGSSDHISVAASSSAKTTRRESFATEHSEGGLTTVAAGVSTDKFADDAASETTMGSSPASAVLGSQSDASPVVRPRNTSPTKRGVTLPQLHPMLKEQGGVYEDYLKWQRDYQKWRASTPSSSTDEAA